MRTISLLAVVGPAVFCLASLCAIGRVENAIAEESTREEAEHLWEQAIAAKGGRERLQAVRNLAVSTGAARKKTRSRPGDFPDERLFVFPDRCWFWFDHRPSKIGLVVEMYNYDRGLFYTTYGHIPESPIADEANERGTNFIDEAQYLYLMETMWLKPTPIRVTRGRANERPVDIVETRVNGRKVSYALDQETHLPVIVTRYGWLGARTYPNGDCFRRCHSH